MLFAYLKKLVEGGEGKFHVIRIGAEGEEALNVKRDMYLSDDWADATEGEYHEQFNAPQMLTQYIKKLGKDEAGNEVVEGTLSVSAMDRETLNRELDRHYNEGWTDCGVDEYNALQEVHGKVEDKTDGSAV